MLHMQIDHYKRFVGRAAQSVAFGREELTVILSPHIDDIILSLYEHMADGSLGKNLIGINFFTANYSSVKTVTRLSFGAVSKTSVLRMSEELMFSKHLAKKGINYLPSFLGMRDAALNDYYKFIFSGIASKWTGKPMTKLHNLQGYYNKLDLPTVLERLMVQYRGSVRKILMPMGLSSHRDHMLFTKLSQDMDSGIKLGLYCDIPYIHKFGYDTIERLKELAPEGYSNISSKMKNPSQKRAAFKSIYPSQYDRAMDDAINEVAETTGEVVFWYR
ncbi:MAG: hypothetical protein KGH60_05110 [Candidatus Micrarchaeota archaeon]|nr:hypothetical protein [Candidatus Micrarchaeota archaeon]